MTHRLLPTWPGPLLCLVAIGGCSSNGGDAPATRGAAVDARYALVSGLFGDDGPTTYVSTIDSLDVATVNLGDAHEFPGLASAAASNGKLFVSSSEAPEVTRFTVDDDGAWSEEGTISFANRLSAGGVTNVFVDGTSAYASEDVVARIVWDPEALLITETRDAASGVPLERDGYSIYLGHDHAVRDGRVFQPVYWSDDDGVNYSAISADYRLRRQDRRRGEGARRALPAPPRRFAGPGRQSVLQQRRAQWCLAAVLERGGEELRGAHQRRPRHHRRKLHLRLR
ncbi:MAG: hypothetical protein QM756_18635 [Polyangiaceae bacterium]